MSWPGSRHHPADATRSSRCPVSFTSCLRAFVFFGICSASALAGERIEIAWPTPSTAWAEGRPENDLLQHAGSGEPESGGFGGVRTGGTQFHEGIDIKPVARDRRGEPTDAVSAAMGGVVRHISSNPGNSSYGRYVVLEHPDMSPGVYTLYAHLARIAPGLSIGQTVRIRQVLGIMGHSSGGYVIPKDRAHLHFEIGVMMTRNFQSWYDARKFGSRNEHNLWNGMNLMGIDPYDFMDAWRTRRVNNFQDYFARMEPSGRLKIATRKIPDFVTRYPALVTKPIPATLGGWEIKFAWTGLPFEWTPLSPMETVGLPSNQPVIVDANASTEHRQRSKSVVVMRRGKWTPGSDLQTVLQQLFGS
jgi:murein DD-endopeptidase MepM/ murein hydrolase activator NlpD